MSIRLSLDVSREFWSGGRFGPPDRDLVRPDQFFCGRSGPAPGNVVLSLALTLALALALGNFGPAGAKLPGPFFR